MTWPIGRLHISGSFSILRQEFSKILMALSHQLDQTATPGSSHSSVKYNY